MIYMRSVALESPSKLICHSKHRNSGTLMIPALKSIGDGFVMNDVFASASDDVLCFDLSVHVQLSIYSKLSAQTDVHLQRAINHVYTHDLFIHRRV